MNRSVARVAVAACLWGLWPLWLRASGLPGPVGSAVTLLVLAAGIWVVRAEPAGLTKGGSAK